jgi:hypothetical protein
MRRARVAAMIQNPTTLRSEYFRRNGSDEKRAKDCADVVSVERGA